MRKRWLTAAVGITAITAVVLWIRLRSENRRDPNETGESLASSWTAAEAEKAGKDLSGGKCTGRGPALLTALPMKPDDFSIIVSYGAVIGGHVAIPTAHQPFLGCCHWATPAGARGPRRRAWRAVNSAPRKKTCAE